MGKINDIKDVKEFFIYLYTKRSLAFHPDDNFDIYINLETGEQTFSKEECEKYDNLMAKCFEICETANIDIYELATSIFNQYVLQNN